MSEYVAMALTVAINKMNTINWKKCCEIAIEKIDSLHNILDDSDEVRVHGSDITDGVELFQRHVGNITSLANHPQIRRMDCKQIVS